MNQAAKTATTADTIVGGVSGLEIFGMIALLVLVLVGTYFATRFIAKFMGGQYPAGKTANLLGNAPVRVINRVNVGRAEYLLTVVYNEREYFIGVTEGGMHTIDYRDLADDEIDMLAVTQSESIGSKLSKLYQFKKGEVDEQ